MRAFILAAAAAFCLAVPASVSAQGMDTLRQPFAQGGGQQSCGGDLKLTEAPPTYKELIVMLDPTDLADPKKGNPTSVTVQFVMPPDKVHGDKFGNVISAKKCTYSSGTVAVNYKVGIRWVTSNGNPMLATIIPFDPALLARHPVGTTKLKGLDGKMHHYDAFWATLKQGDVAMVVFKRATKSASK